MIEKDTWDVPLVYYASTPRYGYNLSLRGKYTLFFSLSESNKKGEEAQASCVEKFSDGEVVGGEEEEEENKTERMRREKIVTSAPKSL